ncbi:MAG: hypothetical protein IT462_06270 [Planctomycetes bacterium]|nr:hypothetical protein [Planctomycetota bacterium]
MSKTVLIAVVCLLAAPLVAEVTVGKPAPFFKVDGDCANPVELKTLTECKGEVILLVDWHVRDIPTQKIIKQVQGLWDKYRGKGLHVFATHRLNMERIDAVEDYCVKNKITLCSPICAFGETNDFDAYFVKDKMYITVIDIDGKVAYYNTSGGWQTVLETELKKVVYPNLLRQAVVKPLESAAVNFGLGFFGKGMNLARTALEGELDAAGKDDARYIIKRGEEILERKRKRIEKEKERRHYVQVFEWLEELTRAFKDTEVATAAEKEIKTLKDDKKVKEELKAQESLIYVINGARGKGKAQRVNTLRTFAKNFPGTRAADDAEELATRLENAEY